MAAQQVFGISSQGELMLVWGLNAYNYSHTATTGYINLTDGGGNCYWSSTAYYSTIVPAPYPTTTPGGTTTIAWYLLTNTINSGVVLSDGKFLTCGVRAVRAFTY